MDCFRDDGAFRGVGGIASENKRAELFLSTDICLNVGGIADCFLDLTSMISHVGCFQGVDRHTSASSAAYWPINPSSDHSKITKLAKGSLSWDSDLVNFTKMKGSTSPPQALRLYIPEHRCRCASSDFCRTKLAPDNNQLNGL